jgi:hypothetical protein
MANQISINASVTTTVDGLRTTVSSNTNNNQLSSSNSLAGSQNITGSGWTTISFTGLSDVIALTVLNDATVYSQSVVQVLNGTNVLGTLTPGTQLVTPWSGSMASISARVTGYYVNSTFASASYVQQGNGTIQFLVQES